ncbi:S-layer homology domain-containing protein [Thermus sp.]|uniref:S-layer homology domain-containing protein n=1 Tax=Thermus sp. TaxID=275 RepID=UPI003D123621
MRREALLGLLLAASAAQAQTRDIPPGHWAEGAVQALIERGILVGYPDGTFKGERPLSRYQMAVTLYRAYLTWTEEVLARVRKTLEEQGVAPERVAELYGRVADLLEVVPGVQKALEEHGVRLEALEKDLEEVRQALLAAMEAQGALKDLEGLKGALARLEGRLGEEGNRLAQMEARVKALEAALSELSRKVEENEAARVKDAQATGKRVYALEEKAKALEAGLASRARAQVYAGVEEGGPFGGLALEWREARVDLGTDRVEASLEAGPVRVAYRSFGGREEALARYALFQGIRLVGELGAGDGRYYFGAAYVEHEPEGGLLPGVHARIGAGAGLVAGEPGRYFLEVQGGARLGPVDLALGYGRYWGLGAGDTPFSALSATLAYPGEGLAGRVRLAYAVPQEDIGLDRGLLVEAEAELPLSPFRVSLQAGYREGLLGEGVASHVDRYRFTTATGFYGRVRVSYEVRF